MATVKIVYTGLVVDEIRPGMNIPRVFLPTSSYIDTPVFTQGYENKDGVGDGQSYGKSIYATNVDGWGKLFGLLPMATNSHTCGGNAYSGCRDTTSTCIII